MFKNPLKYQQGGSVQDAMQQLVAWIVQNTGLDEGQVSQRLSQILSDDTAKQELVNNLQNMQKGDQDAAERIKNMFAPQNAKFGGKIQDFICKHGKGGKTGCGCKENGGEVLKGQHGLSSGRFDIPFGAYMKAYFNKRSTPNVGAATNRSFGYSTSNGNEYYLEDANVGRNSVDTWVNVTPQKDTIIMQKLPSDHINDLEDYQMETIMQRMRPDIKRVNNQENGGKVEKAQEGTGSLYQRITSDGPETYTDGYGTVRQMNESPIITGLRKAYHWINRDRSLSDEAYLQKHGYAKPIMGMPPAVTPIGKINPAELERATARAAGWGAVSDAIAEILPGWAMAGAAAVAKDEIDKNKK